MPKIAIPGAVGILFVLLNIAALAIIITQLSGLWAISATLLLIMLALVVTRIEMKGAMMRETLRRRKMQDIIVDRLDAIASAVDGARMIFSTNTDKMYDKLHANVDMQRRVWTHDFEVRHNELKERVARIEEKVERLKRISPLF